MTTISIEVDNDIAKTFFQASNEEKRKLQILLSLRLKELIGHSNKPLLEIMNEIGEYSEAQGMTPELLESLLNEK